MRSFTSLYNGMYTAAQCWSLTVRRMRPANESPPMPRLAALGKLPTLTRRSAATSSRNSRSSDWQQVSWLKWCTRAAKVAIDKGVLDSTIKSCVLSRHDSTLIIVDNLDNVKCSRINVPPCCRTTYGIPNNLSASTRSAALLSVPTVV